MYLLNRKSLSLNDIESVSRNIFNCVPPMSYGEILTDGCYTTRSMRCFIIKRYYNYLHKRIA
jgi:hypothetical protein